VRDLSDDRLGWGKGSWIGVYLRAAAPRHTRTAQTHRSLATGSNVRAAPSNSKTQTKTRGVG